MSSRSPPRRFCTPGLGAPAAEPHAAANCCSFHPGCFWPPLMNCSLAGCCRAPRAPTVHSLPARSSRRPLRRTATRAPAAAEGRQGSGAERGRRLLPDGVVHTAGATTGQAAPIPADAVPAILTASNRPSGPAPQGYNRDLLTPPVPAVHGSMRRHHWLAANCLAAAALEATAAVRHQALLQARPILDEAVVVCCSMDQRRSPAR